MLPHDPRRVSPTVLNRLITESSAARRLTWLTTFFTRSTRSAPPRTLALVGVRIYQPLRLFVHLLRTLSPSLRCPSFTTPSPSAWTRLTSTFAIDHRLGAQHLDTTSQETYCTHHTHARVSLKLNQSIPHLDNHSSQTRTTWAHINHVFAEITSGFGLSDRVSCKAH